MFKKVKDLIKEQPEEVDLEKHVLILDNIVLFLTLAIIMIEVIDLIIVLVK